MPGETSQKRSVDVEVEGGSYSPGTASSEHDVQGYDSATRNPESSTESHDTRLGYSASDHTWYKETTSPEEDTRKYDPGIGSATKSGQGYSQGNPYTYSNVDPGGRTADVASLGGGVGSTMFSQRSATSSEQDARSYSPGMTGSENKSQRYDPVRDLD